MKYLFLMIFVYVIDLVVSGYVPMEHRVTLASFPRTSTVLTASYLSSNPTALVRPGAKASGPKLRKWGRCNFARKFPKSR